MWVGLNLLNYTQLHGIGLQSLIFIGCGSPYVAQRKLTEKKFEVNFPIETTK